MITKPVVWSATAFGGIDGKHVLPGVSDVARLGYIRHTDLRPPITWKENAMSYYPIGFVFLFLEWFVIVIKEMESFNMFLTTQNSTRWCGHIYRSMSDNMSYFIRQLGNGVHNHTTTLLVIESTQIQAWLIALIYMVTEHGRGIDNEVGHITIQAELLLPPVLLYCFVNRP